ncbi:hypothetical protein RMATCC62417_10311 [Rhizopus microsporus]|nr:hypothetical protein RMATCC62417_10311 [Rhizopus microsporus]
MTSINGGMHDVLAGEFANSKLGPWKFTADHLKFLRESKITLDHTVNQELTTACDARRLIMSRFQANALEDVVKLQNFMLPACSVDIPSNTNSLRHLRKKTIPRLRYMKYHALKNAHILTKSVEKEVMLKKKKNAAYGRSPSCDNIETVVKWMRSTWFPNREKGSKVAGHQAPMEKSLQSAHVPESLSRTWNFTSKRQWLAN